MLLAVLRCGSERLPFDCRRVLVSERRRNVRSHSTGGHCTHKRDTREARFARIGHPLADI